MLPYGRGGVAGLPGAGAFAPVTERVIGNQLPGWTGSSGNTRDVPAPHAPGQPIGGQTGKFDGSSGADPWVAKRQPFPRRIAPVVEGQASNGAGPALGAGAPMSAMAPLGYGQGAGRAYGLDGWGWAARLAAPRREDPFPHGRESFRRFGIQGYNDQLQVRDRHAYWDRGRSRNLSTAPPQVQASGRNPQLDGPPRPDLRTVNISANPQIGSDNTRLQDDLSRPYTWLGQQDGTVVPVYGGVPGMWQSYGNRGLARGIHDPTNGEGGLVQVRSGPPHGLHSDTLPSYKQSLDRYRTTPQMRPVRIDRPDNSRISGQSFSQTVQPQAMTGQAPVASGNSARGGGLGLTFSIGGRGWAGN